MDSTLPGFYHELALPLVTAEEQFPASNEYNSSPGVSALVIMPLTATAASLAEVLDELTAEGAGELTELLPQNALKCYACGHRCIINEGKRGICKVRFNEGGHLRVPANYVAALACDPTEKKPFFHALPGSDTLTFGMLGCDLHCAYCQNWLTSQALRDDAAVSPPKMVTADRLVTMAKAYGAAMVGSSYNEPLITAEWAIEVFRKAKPEGFRTAFISNGNATPQVLDYLRPWTDCYKIDLKTMNDRNYRQLGGVVDNILDTVKMVHDRGFGEEIVTLVIPGFNDSEDELKRAADFIASVSPDIPWHVTAFHQDYHMRDHANTTAGQLFRACEIGREAGLRFVYAGNLPGRVGRWENTYCPNCDELLVERYGYIIRAMRVTPDGCCPSCAQTIPGVWS
jgi:pyruvate formate lyase activating enzyme